ncbi:helix-hairpin-helix domain-containing protein [Bacillus thermotolerans]|uniref:helix-hairpin-helix domain-containing protein n=1 Tax=Bacillus thermotolerans TaxID=1221996 RepID=UPI00058917F5|nr:helix-hairpin-helix domain-containing protein [Bacillus thermotolerans]KKB43580.1 Late competence protein ComEA, DNA receptor [Bacillus thermotolerans]
MDVKAWLEKNKAYVLGGAALLVVGLSQIGEDPLPVSEAEPLALEEETVQEEEGPSEPAEQEVAESSVLMVDVKGAVEAPGIYSMNNGDRINDVIAKAGGFQEEADPTAVNLAQKLQDEMIIYVPKAGEEVPAMPAASSGTPSSGTAGSPGASTTERVNINTATLDQLQQLPGIGASKAQAIIEYRETSGLFAQPEDLKNVSGIGDKTFEKLASHIVVQ